MNTTHPHKAVPNGTNRKPPETASDLAFVSPECARMVAKIIREHMREKDEQEAKERRRKLARIAFSFSLHPSVEKIDYQREADDITRKSWQNVGNYLRLAMFDHIASRGREIRKGRYQHDEIRKKAVISKDCKKAINNTPTDISDNLKQEVISTLIISYSSGQLPPPEMLKALHEINPEDGEKILEQAQEEQRNHSTQSQGRSDADNKTFLRGQLLFFGILFTSLITGIVLVVLDEKLFGTFLTFAPLAALFIIHKLQHRFNPANI